MSENTLLLQEEAAVPALRALYEKHGYRKFKVRRFEEYAYYLENRNFLTSKNIPTFTDLDGRLLALKPDVTLSIIKHTRSGGENAEKLYYVENVYRENSDATSYREISQMGLEYLGRVDTYILLEITQLAVESLLCFGRPARLTIGHSEFTLGMLEAAGLEPAAHEDMLEALRMKSAHGLKTAALKSGLAEAAAEKMAALASLNGGFLDVLQRASGFAQTPRMRQALEELHMLYEAARQSGNAGYLSLDLTLLNDINYYNGIVYLGYIEGVPRQVLSGGRYDKMMRKLGRKSDAIGFAVYLDELAHLNRQDNKAACDVLLYYDDSIEPAAVWQEVRRLTAQGLSVRAEKAGRFEGEAGAVYYWRNGGWEEGGC